MTDVEEDAVDIDELVDHYLGVSVTCTKDSTAVSSDENNCNDTHRSHRGDASFQIGEECNGETENSQYAFLNNGSDKNTVLRGADETDVEAIVESILQEQRHSKSDDAPLSLVREEEKESTEHLPRAVAASADDLSCRSVSSRRANGSVGGSGRVFRRLMLWEERREAKRLQAVYEALLQEQVECTFQPLDRDMTGSRNSNSESIVDNDPCSSVGDVNGVDGFLQRMREARNARERKMRAAEGEANRYRDRSTWRPSITIPKPFDLGKKPRNMALVTKNMDTFKKYGARMRSKLQNEPSKIGGPALPSGFFSLQSSELFLRHIPPRTP